MHAYTVETGNWWAQPRDASAAWIANYQQSLQSPQRAAIEGVVRQLAPETLFEVGCHCGPNLVRLAKALPELRMHGIDANAEAILAGRRWVETLQIADRVALTCQRFPAGTYGTPTGFADVVLSCYSLAYIAPADLDAALYEIGRLAGRAVILAEPMPIGEDRPAMIGRSDGYKEWAHDYQQALAWVGSLRNVKTRLVPIVPRVDRLSAILVVERLDPITSSTP